ncbi:MAG: LLM class flavin-dependent oxidoreductase [Actinomycetota bacterium]
MTPTICLEVWGADPRDLITVARHAESVGLEGVYLGESPTALNAETWTSLGAIAAATEHLRIGPVIANLLPDYRSPILLARQGATLAALSGGRFDFRTGAGASRSAGRAWWQPAGVDYPAYEARLEQTEHQLGLLRRLWRGEVVEIAGAGFELGQAHPGIEITLAATGPRALAVAGRLADRWETSFSTVEEWRIRAADASGGLRTSLEIDAFVGSGTDPDRIWRDAARDRDGEDLEAIRARSLVGAPATIAEQLHALGAAGVERLVVALHDPHDLDAITGLGEAARAAR